MTESEPKSRLRTVTATITAARTGYITLRFTPIRPQLPDTSTENTDDRH